MPVPVHLNLPVLQYQGVAGGEFEDILKYGIGGRNVFQGQEKIQSPRLKLSLNLGMSQDSFELGTEDQGSVRELRVVKGLYSQAVADHHQSLLPAVPYRRDKHSAQFLGKIQAPFFIGMQYGFGVCAGFEHMACRQQFLTQLWEIVDLSVVDDPIEPSSLLMG